MVQSPSATVLHVNSATGDDRATGQPSSPYKTLTQALRQATSGTVIRLAAGTYSTASGEIFPISIPVGVAILGDEVSKGRNIVIEGSGVYASPTFASQNVAILPQDQSQLRGVTVTNRAARGTGVWIESTAPTIANSTFVQCGREGIFATGTARALILDNIFQQNAASGISVVRNAKGEIRRNRCERTGYGIAVSDNAAPLLTDNQTSENRAGIVVSKAARPVLRNNLVERNTSDGLVLLNTAAPDLGKSQAPGGNIFRENGGFDLRNATATTVLSAGNQVALTRVEGPVEFVASQVSPQPASTPVPIALPSPTPGSSPSPIVVSAPLADISGHWGEAFIRGLVERQIISGFPDGTFKPEQPITRAQYAAVLAKAFDAPFQRASQGFRDVPANFWAAGAIARAERMGFLSGFPDGTFRPNQNLTRIQTIVSLIGGLNFPQGNPTVLGVYRDRAQIPSYATNAVATATQQRIVVNYPDPKQLAPLIDITRAEVAAMIYQALVATGQVRAIASAHIVTPDAATPSFADLQGHWAAGFIRGLASQSFISGFADGTFKPDLGMSRAQFATLLANAFNPSPKRPAAEFRDVPSNFWAAAAIQKVYRGGLLSGFGDGLFQPNQNILRLHVMLSLANGLELPVANLQNLSFYQDQNTLPTFARDPVARATTQRIIVNYPQIRQLNPNRDATRGEVAAMVYQGLVQSGRSPAISSAYIVDTAQQGATPVPAPTPAPTPTPTPTPAPAPIPTPAPTPAQPNPVQTVVLDPGHGGADPGAIGIGGLREKDVIFPITLEAGRLLQQRGVRVVFTRSDDRTLDLETRVQIAQQANADAFVSIHANALNLSRPDVNGLETYHYPGSTTGAALAQAIHRNLTASITVVDRGVRQANFYVLRRTTMPATLVEVGFVTGQQDAANLADSNHRNRIAQAIAQGTWEYLQNR